MSENCTIARMIEQIGATALDSNTETKVTQYDEYDIIHPLLYNCWCHISLLIR